MKPRSKRNNAFFGVFGPIFAVFMTSCNSLGTRFTNSIGMEFTSIPSGQYKLSSKEQAKTDLNQTFSISSNYAIGTSEVTQAQWKSVMGSFHPSFEGDPERPVEGLSPKECLSFIRKLNSLEPASEYRLPNEFEWEIACGGGNSGGEVSNPDKAMWAAENSGSAPHPVRLKAPNPIGIYDILGNVSEWCIASKSSDSLTAGEGPFFVVRGGSSSDDFSDCKLTKRSNLFNESDRLGEAGFRIVCATRNSIPRYFKSKFKNSTDLTYSDPSPKGKKDLFLIKSKIVGSISCNLPINRVELPPGYSLEPHFEVEHGEEGIGSYKTKFFKLYDSDSPYIEQISIRASWSSLTQQHIDRVGTIFIHSSNYSTDKGIHVGSTIKELLKAYPKAKLHYYYWTFKYGFYIDVEGLDKIHFFPSRNDYLKELELTDHEPDIRNFSQNAKINEIMVF